MSKIFLATDSEKDQSLYLEEILHTLGLCSTRRGPLAACLGEAHPLQDVIVLSREGNAVGIEGFLEKGGQVIALQPSAAVEEIAGLKRTGEYDNPARLRLVQPICYGVRGEPLWTRGSIRSFAPNPCPQVVAYIYKPDEAAGETSGIWRTGVGKGALIVYAYDPAVCVMRLRQGDPEKAGRVPAESLLPKPLRTPRATYLQSTHADFDTFWKPTADLHVSIFCELIKDLLSTHAPVPVLWHLPQSQGSLVIYTGDEDGATQQQNNEQMKNLEAARGGMNLYVIPNLTSITRADIEDYTRRGHTISVHPNLVALIDESPSAQLEQAEKQVKMFQEKFQCPTRTVRNHCYMWPGYLALPELWERLGVGMDFNTTGTLYGTSLESGPYANVHTALPMRFVREDGSLIDVFQQATQVNDDLTGNPTTDYSLKFLNDSFAWSIERLLDEASVFYHVPICVNIHPENYAKFSKPLSESILEQARRLKIPVWSADRWHNFWRTRATWTLSECVWHHSELTCHYQGTPCEGLSIILPVAIFDQTLSSVKVDDQAISPRQAKRNGREVAHISLPEQADAVTVLATYR